MYDNLHFNNLRIIIISQLGINTQTIGVIAPYRVQVHLLRKVVPSDIEVNTVDQYQGRDKSVIIYSCSKSISKDTKIQVTFYALNRL